MKTGEKFAFLTDREKMRRIFARRLARPDGAPEAVRGIRIKPLKIYRDKKTFNAVIRYDLVFRGGKSFPVVGLAASDNRKRYASAASNLIAPIFAASRFFRIPETYAYVRPLGLLLIEYVSGESLVELLRCRRNPSNWIALAAKWLAHLQRAKPPGADRVLRRGMDFTDIEKNFRILGFRPEFWPAMKRRLERLSLESRAICHGDFNPSNIIMRGAQCVVIDFEKMHLGHPLEDPAAFVSHLEYLPDLRLPPQRRKRLQASFARAYGISRKNQNAFALFRAFFDLLAAAHMRVWGNAAQKRKGARIIASVIARQETR